MNRRTAVRLQQKRRFLLDFPPFLAFLVIVHVIFSRFLNFIFLPLVLSIRMLIYLLTVVNSTFSFQLEALNKKSKNLFKLITRNVDKCEKKTIKLKSSSTRFEHRSSSFTVHDVHIGNTVVVGCYSSSHCNSTDNEVQ